MAVGRITGPLLASNLLRDGVNLAVETNLLYLDVTTGRIGVKTSSPQYELDVNGTLNAAVLRVSNTATLGLITVTKTVSSGTIGSTLGPIHIDPAGNNKIYLDADTEVAGNLHATGNITADGNIQLGDTTSTDTLKVGAEIISNLIPQTPNTFNIGSQSQNWKNGYFTDLFAGNMHLFGNTLTNTLPGAIDIIPKDGTVNIHGNIKVWGGTPLGTSPVTQNVLYVNMDGSDTNDGGAMDPSRACRTISAAVKSPLYKPGTSIKVAPGYYLENNPIELKPYTSVIGSDLRTTMIEPINKTQDLFHVRSGCYIAQLMMKDGRSGRFPGDGYKPNTNRGAYATAFPPNGDNGTLIDVFHSPYIQNCTNQSGPWLYDGTMFVPNQTVQVPEAVGVATYNAGDQEITIQLTEGQLTVGQAINGGPPNRGFYNARTLLLANKPFIQEQVVAYINQTYGGPFQYNETKCARDTGLIIKGVGLDLLYDGTSQSVFSGLQYWAQDGYTGQIGREVTTTTNTFNYVKSIAQQIARGQSVSSPYQNTITQVTSVPSGFVGALADATRIGTLITTTTNVINEGTSAITDKIIDNGNATTDVNTLGAIDLLQANKEFMKAEAIAWITANVTGFTYDQAKCSRDTGLIVDAIAQDLLFNGTSQTDFSGIQYWNHSTTESIIPGELSTTTAAISYIKGLAQKIVVNDTTGARYSAAVQTTSTNYGTSAEASIVGADFQVVIDILNNGVSGVTDIIVPNGLTSSGSTNVQNAYALLQANKAYLQTEAIAYIEAIKTFGYTYNSTTCERDVGYIVDSISFDLLYGGNRQAVQSGVYYYGYNASSTAIPNEVVQTTAAYNYMKSLFANIVRGIAVVNPFQSAISQITAQTPGTSVESAIAEGLVDRITNIITNGPSQVTSKTPISLTRSVDANVIAAAQMLEANKNFIKAEVIAFINANYGSGFQYDQALCKRDVGYLIDCVSFDLLRGGNRQSIQAGVCYYGWSTTSSAIPNEQPQTILAYDYMKSVIKAVVQSQELTSFYQSEIPQVLDNVNPGTLAAANVLGNNIDIITRLIRTGPDGAPSLVPISLTETTDPGYINAYNLLVSNFNFIKAEVIAYTSSLPNFIFNEQKCYRDTGILVENISFDALAGGNAKAVESGIAYYEGVNSVITGQTTECIGGIEYIKTLASKIIRNQTCPNLLGSTATQAQVINYVLTDGGIAQESLDKGFDIVTNIIANGSSVAPAVVDGSAIDPYYMSAEVLLEANRTFIQDEIVTFVNKSFLNFPFNSAKCRRDTGLVVDSLALDLMYPTSEDSQSNFTGLQYWNQGSYTGLIQSELTTTTNAISYLSGLAQKIILNDTSGPRYQSVATQNTSIASGTTNETTSVGTNFDLIIDVITNGTYGITDKIVPNGDKLTTPGVVNAYNQLLTNLDYMKAEVIAYVESTKTAGFTYNQSKCARDVGYIVQSIAFDLLHGGNRQAVQSAVTYYDFNSASTAIPNEVTETVAAYTHLKNVITGVCLSTAVNRTQGNTLTQVIDLPPSTQAQVDLLTAKIDLIIDIIQNGPSAANTLVPINLTRSTNTDKEKAYALLNANRAFIAQEIVAFVNYTYNGAVYSYNKTKCSRDTGIIVDSMITDLLFPDNGYTQSNFAGLQYWNQDGYTGEISRELSTTTAAINYVSSLAQKLVLNDTSGTRYQSAVSQNTGLPVATSAQATAISTDFGVITNILNNGTTGVTDIIVAPGQTQQSANALKAFNILQANKAYLEAEAIAYVEATKGAGFSYNKDKCYRDTGLIVDAIVQDLLHNGTTQSTFAGVQYWNHNGYTGQIASELTTTTNAISHVKSVARRVILNDTTGARFSTGISQTTSPSAPATNDEVITITQDFEVITSILTNGVDGVTDIIVPNGITASSVTGVVNAYNLLQANKAYLEAEAVAYVEFNKTVGFTYDQSKCARDVGYMIDSICFDLLYGGNKQAVQSGVYYYGFDGSSSAIANEQTEAIAAYNYIKTILPSIVAGTQVQSYQGNAYQVLDMTPGNTTQSTVVQGKIDVITNIIQNGPGVAATPAPISLAYNNDTNVVNTAKIITANKQFIQEEVIQFIERTYTQGFQYDKTKCARDVGYMVDCVSFDVLYGGNRQAVQSGVYYYGFSNLVSTIANERSQTTKAYQRLKEILPQIVLNQAVSATNGNSIVQNVGLTAATQTQADELQAMCDLIISIINEGQNAGIDRQPLGLTMTVSQDAKNAAAILEANRDFIRSEIVAWVDQTYTTGFTYDKTKCSRDTGLIVDALVTDLGWNTNGFTQSNFAGLQYWNQAGYTGEIGREVTTTTNAITYLKTLAKKVVVNNTSFTPYQTAVTQNTSLPVATGSEVTDIDTEMNQIITIINNGTEGVTDLIVSNGTGVVSTDKQKAFNILQANKAFLQAEVVAYVEATRTSGFVYDQAKCYRDMGFIIDSVCFDILYGGNKQAIMSAVYYYGFSGVQSAIPGEESQTTLAYNRIRDIVEAIITNTPILPSDGNTVKQVFTGTPSSPDVALMLYAMIDNITNIIQNGPEAADTPTPVGLVANTDTNVQRAMDLLQLNRNFIRAEIIAYVDKAYGNNYYFNYNQEKCYRDVGLMVDAIAQDVLLGGNKKTIEAGLTYWTGAVNVIASEVPQTNAALDYLKVVAQNVVSNKTFPTLSTTKQLVNTFFGGGVNAVESINRLIDILQNIIAKGPDAAPESYEGSGVFAKLTTSAHQTTNASTVLDITELGNGQYRVYLSQPVLGAATNATLYFGQTAVYPTLDKNVPDRWAQRKIDPNGSCGGALIDGAVVSARSPVQSFVFDAFTQLNQGGIGIKITNSGYAQLVSVFTIFCGTSVIVENGGICSITNSNANFGDFCLVAKGYSKREFFGEVYNPPVLPYYPNGYFPQNQQVQIYVPDPDNRPHIGQIMEVIPPEDYTNSQGLPGFLSASLNTSTLTTSSITINGIDTSGIVIGQSIYARDQYGSYTNISGTRYIPEGTIVTDINFKSVTLSNSITAGGGDVNNANYFTLYIAGNAYYTVRSSVQAPDPIVPGTLFIGSDATIQGNTQTTQEVQAIHYINTLTNSIIANKLVNALQTTATQVTNLALPGGAQAEIKVGELFGILETIITGGVNAAPEVTKSGVVAPGAANAGALLLSNKSFLQAEILEYINSNYFVYDHDLCRRDLGYILDGFGWDILTGSNYQAIKCGNAYLRASSAYVLAKEKTETLDAIDKIYNLCATTQGISTVTNALTQLQTSNSELQSIIGGNGSVLGYQLPNPSGTSTGKANGKSLIIDNISFLKEEVIAWINYNYPVYTYDTTKCKRDIGLVLDGVKADMLLGTNYRSIKSGQAYFRGNANNVLNNEFTQTLAGFEFVKNYLLEMTEVAASSTATQTVISDFANISTILNGGISAAPTVTYTIPPGTSTGVSSASQLLQANLSFIKSEVEAYIYLTYPGLTYSRSKCKRDVGLLVEALIYDLTYGGNSMSVDAALQYFNSANNNVRVNPSEVTETVAGINYINTMAQRIIQNLAVLTTYQNPVVDTQVINPSLVQGVNASSTISTLISDMANIVENGPNAAPLITNPDTSWAVNSIETAVSAIESDTGLIASEAIAYINETYTVFTYNQDICRRDTEYVIWSLLYDLTYGGNWQSVDAGLNYWKGTVSLVPNEITQTSAAFEYLNSIMKKVANNETVTPTVGNTQTQTIDFLRTGGDAVNSTLDTLTVILSGIIRNGADSAPAIEYPTVTGYATDVTNVKNIIATQKATLIDNTITYIDNKYTGFEYSQAICKRDVGYIVDAISSDLTTGGNYNTVLAGQSYYARANTHHYVTLEDNVADATLFPDRALVNFYRRSYMSASGYLFEYVGAGSNYGALPYVGRFDPNQEREVVQLNNGKVFFTSTDQNGDFRIGPGLVISQATGVLSGRTFTKSLFANLTPFILAIEG